ncbi:MAG: FAD binding domain-containing protein [Rhodospirillales bacterium]|jgi:carbon-monoxide dehydrogenase medium subunit
MKFPAFDYVSPASLDEVVAILGERGDAAVLLAGGQSLMPILAFRLAAPDIIVDLKNVPGLDVIDAGGDGVRLGARVRWRDIERNAALATKHPLLVEATHHIAHYQVRNRGTVGGSLALADPAAELPGIAVTCNAEIAITGSAGERLVKAGDFFLGPMTTSLAAGEIITGLSLPAWPQGRRWAFLEFARRRGDFAMAGIAVFYDLDAAGQAAGTHIGVIGASDRPHRLGAAEQVIDGSSVDDAAIEAAAAAAAEAVDPIEDFHAPGEYRRGLVKTLVERALQQAAS